MKKRILALALSLAMLCGVLPFAAFAVPYSPSANAWKDFGQEHLYLYEVTKGEAAPRMDGYVTDSDGYGEPIATYGFRYCTTADYVTPDIDQGEFKLREDGTYFVYPNENSSQEVWDSITSMETDSPYGYIWTVRVDATSFSPTGTYYYLNPQTNTFGTAYRVTAETFKNYTALNARGEYVLNNAKALTEEPADWATNFASYYTKPSGYAPVKAAEDGKAPAFKTGTCYSGDRITVQKLFQNQEGNTAAIASVQNLKTHHVILPEKINVYARYNDNYLYYAIEVTETRHQTTQYKDVFYYGTNMSNAMVSFCNAFDFSGNISKNPQGNEAAKMTASTAVRTYVNTSQDVNDLSMILRKYGNLSATSLDDVTQVGVDYNITHSPYVEKKAEEPEEYSEDDWMNNYEEEEDDLSSGYYGTTVYEYRVPWKVLNGKYSPNTSSTAVPEMFTCRNQLQLENSLMTGYFIFSFTLPRETRGLPGSINRSGGNYPKDKYMMRYANNAGLTTGSDYGTYNFMWSAVSSTYGNWEPYLTEYASVTTRKTVMAAHISPVFFTAGQEPSSEYAKPTYVGANIRADGAEDQKIRIEFSIPKTDKEIEEAGVIVAPTEVARRNQLRLGLSSIAYYCEENPVLYGVDENGNWINMTEDADKYFASVATPNDSDSYIAVDQFGGKPSGIYTVYTLATDLDNPYGPYRDPETLAELGTIYTVVFGGPNGEGLFHDFDDFFTFYTFRPYIKYKDGTVVYGEHEYKSIYYLACFTIQDILSNYNEQVTGLTNVEAQYNMDQMYLATVTDSKGNTLKDPQGKNLYVPVANTPAAYSLYAGGAERSIYWPEPRLEVFRWYAVRTINRANNTSLRAEYYDDFHEDVKALVDQYVQMYENIWNVIVQSENTRYVIMK